MNRRDTLAALVALSAAIRPRRLLAQSQPLLGVVQFDPPPDVPPIRPFLAALRELGYAEGKSLRVERRYAHEDASRYPALLEDLARMRPQVVVAAGHDIAQVAKRVTPALNVVTWGSEDPVLSGLVQSLARPGGRITGVTFMSPQAAPKRLEILKEAVPGLSRVAVVWDPTHADTYYRDMEAIAASLGVRISLITVKRPDDLDAIAALAAKGGAEAVFVVPSRLTNAATYARRIAEICLRAKLPAMSAYASFADAGGLLAYGADIPPLIRRAAAQTARILSGVSPAELPIEQATRFVLVINLKTAAAMGLKLADSVLVRAERVIE